MRLFAYALVSLLLCVTVAAFVWGVLIQDLLDISNLGPTLKSITSDPHPDVRMATEITPVANVKQDFSSAESSAESFNVTSLHRFYETPQPECLEWGSFCNTDTPDKDQADISVQLGPDTLRSVTAVVLMGQDRAHHWATMFLPRLVTCDVLKQILVDWWPEAPVPQHVGDLFWPKTVREGSVPVRVIPGKRGLCDRYLIAQYIDTPYVYNTDDDRGFSCQDLKRFLAASRHCTKMGKRCMASAEARVIEECQTAPRHFAYNSIDRKTNQDNFVIPNTAVWPTEFLHIYEKLVPTVFRETCNIIRNCEDVAFNWAVSQVYAHTQYVLKALAKSEVLLRRGLMNPRGPRSMCVDLLYALRPDSKPLNCVQSIYF
eukprot:Selendium_serpulae@DN6313_c0_g1_i10.p1